MARQKPFAETAKALALEKVHRIPGAAAVEAVIVDMNYPWVLERGKRIDLSPHALL
jgi:hypothetical protein